MIDDFMPDSFAASYLATTVYPEDRRIKPVSLCVLNVLCGGELW